MILPFALILFVCEFGEMTTARFEDLGEQLCQECNWYLFPMELQRMFVIVVVEAQEPIIIRGFDNTPCARETFKKVDFFVRLKKTMSELN